MPLNKETKPNQDEDRSLKCKENNNPASFQKYVDFFV